MWFPSILLAKFEKKLEIFFLLYLHMFLPFLQRQTTFVTIFCLLVWKKSPFKMGSTLKEKNLLLMEQILSLQIM